MKEIVSLIKGINNAVKKVGYVVGSTYERLTMKPYEGLTFYQQGVGDGSQMLDL